MAVNAKREKTVATSHLNYMGGPSFDIKNPLSRLEVAATSCFFGEPQYYVEASSEKSKHSPRRIAVDTLSTAERKYVNATLQSLDPTDWRGLGAKERMEQAIDAALAYDAKGTLDLAVRLRQEDHMRVTPQVILVRAAHASALKGTGLVRQYAPRIIQRADEPSTQLAYQLATFGRPIPNQLKKAWGDYLSGASPYALAKYRMEARQVKTVDVVNLSHPTGSPALDGLVDGSLKTTGTTWEAIISAQGSTPAAWQEALDVMGHMALLRNLRNLITQSSVSQDVLADKLVVGAKEGQQLPFRYMSAFKVLEGIARPVLLEALEDCLNTSMDNLPFFTGRTMSLCDNSGSAWGTTTSTMGSMHIAEIANLTAAITALRSKDGYAGIFGDRLEEFTVSKRSSALDLTKKFSKAGQSIGMDTENGVWLFWDKAIREEIPYDAVFVYSDMQAGHGGLYGPSSNAYRDYQWPSRPRYIDVPKLVTEYRQKVNPNVEVFLVQIAGYQDTIIPEHYAHTHILGGWSENILKYAAKFLPAPR